MAVQTQTLAVGSKVFIRVDNAWVKGLVHSTGDGSSLTILTDDKREVVCPAAGCFLQNLDTQDEEDMTRLSHLHEPGVLHNLDVRYSGSHIYTFTGSILIAINPFMAIPGLYGPSVMEQYKGKNLHDMPPHVYATVANAYKQMVEDQKGQAILITGESGAGKTETSKVILRYLAYLGAHRTTGGQSIEQQVLESTPILEAFGNAKTVRNDNSSRFGKYLELHFDDDYRISGAAIRTYLLERSRVVTVNNPERNYHIFYLLCMGASSEERSRWHLTAPSTYHYLNQSTCYELPGFNHEDEYRHVRRAMTCVGISQDDQESSMRIVAAVLHLGNLTFDSDPNSGEGGAMLSPSSRTHLEAAAELLGVEGQELFRVLSTRSRATVEGTIVSPLTPKASMENRDSLAKVLYSRLFNWLVAAINQSIRGTVGTVGDSANGRTIGLLDIYGFESFHTNDFEQLCINLANEKLQQHFNQHVFKWEQAEYEKEGITWKYIAFEDNQDVLDLIEGKSGILQHLDEQCRFPTSTPADLALKLFNTPEVAQSRRFTIPKSKGASFQLSHYAGGVNYGMDNFLEKNKDYVVQEHQALLQASGLGLLTQLFAPEDTHTNGNGHNGTTQNGRMGGANGKRGSSFAFVSVGSQFKQQLGELAAVLGRMQPHYVRCIKPNAASRPLLFDGEYVLNQLKCGGVMEAVRISCAGFPYKRPFDSFVQYFWQLKPSAREVPAAEGAQSIIAASQISEFQMGSTKVFLRGNAAAILEGQRTRVLGIAATKIQSKWKGHLQQERYRELQGATQLLQSAIRGRLARKELERLRQLNAAMVIQTAWRGAQSRLHYKQQVEAALVLQASWRSLQARRQLHSLLQQRAALTLQSGFRALQARRTLHTLRLHQAAVLLQSTWRTRATLQRLRLQRAALLLQSTWRARTCIHQYRIQKAALMLQSSWRAIKARRHFHDVQRSVRVIQHWWRDRHMTGAFIARVLKGAREFNAACVIQAAWRGSGKGRKLADKLRTIVLQYHSTAVASLVVQRTWRIRQAKRRQRREKILARMKMFQKQADQATEVKTPPPAKPSRRLSELLPPTPRSTGSITGRYGYLPTTPRNGHHYTPSATPNFRYPSPGPGLFAARRVASDTDVVKSTAAEEVKQKRQADLEDTDMRSRISSVRAMWMNLESRASVSGSTSRRSSRESTPSTSRDVSTMRGGGRRESNS